MSRGRLLCLFDRRARGGDLAWFVNNDQASKKLTVGTIVSVETDARVFSSGHLACLLTVAPSELEIFRCPRPSSFQNPS